MKKALKVMPRASVDQVLQHLQAVNDCIDLKHSQQRDWYQFQQILFEIYAIRFRSASTCMCQFFVTRTQANCPLKPIHECTYCDINIYHITDIPIIMSREFMIMFDPILTTSASHIRDRSNPGIKINWSKQQKRLRKFPNQFQTFHQCIQLPTSSRAGISVQIRRDTLSAPIRTEQESSASEISSMYYNTTDIYSLVDEFSICGHRTNFVSPQACWNNGTEIPEILKSQTLLWPKMWSASTKVFGHLKPPMDLMKKVTATNRVPADVPKSGCIIRIIVEEFHNVFKRIVDLQSPLFRGSEEDPNQYFEMAAKGIQTRRLTDEMPQKAVEVTNWLICSLHGFN
ncbi:hypothetical protein CRUP_023164 [Coryphaenoides rupestris]|nr:hypothetical protein CRUP_023164 [Coryphaenoides rupestris]